MSLMGIDVGTSACKVNVFSTRGEPLELATRSYRVRAFGQGRFELDPEQVRDAVFGCMVEVNRKCAHDPVSALSFAAQGEAVVAVSEDARALGPVPISADTRGEGYIKRLALFLEESELFRATGQVFDSIHSLGKICWWKEHQPDLYEKTWKFLCFPEYLLLCLGLEPVADETIAARTLMYDISNHSWSASILAWAGVSEEKLPRVGRSGQQVGRPSTDTTRRLGFAAAPIAVVGGHDQACAALGAGATKETVVYTLGTTECISVVSSSQIQEGFYLRLPSYPHVAEGQYITLIGSQAGGRIMEWLAELLGTDPDLEIRRRLFYEELARIPIHSTTPLLFIPEKMLSFEGGSGTALGGGTVTNIGMYTKRVDLILSAMEGITYEQAHRFSRLRAHLPEITGVNAAGGGTRNDVVLQLKADIFGCPIRRVINREAGCAGAAMIAGIGTGDLVDVRQAQCLFVKADKTFQTSQRFRGYHDKKINQYERLRALLE